MKHYVVALCTILLLLGIIGAGYLELLSWQECLADHPFFYCTRILGK